MPDYEEAVMGIMENAGAVLQGHFVYTPKGPNKDQWFHGGVYVNKDALYVDPAAVSRVCGFFAEAFSGDAVEVVAAPAIGGVALCQHTALTMQQQGHAGVRAVFTEKGEDGRMVLKRGYDRVVKDRNVLMLEDITTSGGSLKSAVQVVADCGGRVVGIGVVWNRGGIMLKELLPDPKPDHDVRFLSLVRKQFPMMPEAECTLCRDGVPINTDIGHGAKWLELRKSA